MRIDADLYWRDERARALADEVLARAGFRPAGDVVELRISEAGVEVDVLVRPVVFDESTGTARVRTVVL